MATEKLIFLQLNELNFPYIDEYIAAGKLPNFARLFSEHGYVETTSEDEHELANPWIQWPTVHTGMDYADHKVFRLGDMVYTDHRQIYDVVEEAGYSVAAILAFNSKNTTKNAAFWVPDPWTDTRIDAPASVQMINEALKQATDDYASGKLSISSLMKVAFGGARNLSWKEIPEYLRGTTGYALKGHKWMRAIVADRLLADAFITQVRKSKPDFSTVFLNGGAHLQHHYLFSSLGYKGDKKNPTWHVPEGEDPLYDILKTYDVVLADVEKLAADIGARIIVATGLHQDPHERETWYYRLDDQAPFMKKMGIDFKDTYRLMTEDFVLVFENEEEARRGEEMVLSIEAIDAPDIFYVETADRAVRTMNRGPQVFYTENRGDTIYVQLKPVARPIPENLAVRRGNLVEENFGKLVEMAQYKNTHHHPIGYYSDYKFRKGQLPAQFPLRDVFSLIVDHFGIAHPNVEKMDRALYGALHGGGAAVAAE